MGGRRGPPGTTTPRGAAWRSPHGPEPSRTSRLPSGIASTEPGRPLAFHYRAYESSSPGKYVAIKINRPALSAEHNANYLWAVCAIFIIVQAPGTSCLPASPARPSWRRAQRRSGCGGRGGTLKVPTWGSQGEASGCLLTLQARDSFSYLLVTCWRPTTCRMTRPLK